MDRKTLALAAFGGATLLGAGFLASIGPGSLLGTPRTAPARATVTLVKSPSPTIIVPAGQDGAPAAPAGDAAHGGAGAPESPSVAAATDAGAGDLPADGDAVAPGSETTETSTPGEGADAATPSGAPAAPQDGDGVPLPGEWPASDLPAGDVPAGGAAAGGTGEIDLTLCKSFTCFKLPKIDFVIDFGGDEPGPGTGLDADGILPKPTINAPLLTGILYR